MVGPKQTYTQKEVTEILKRALRQQSLREQELGHDDLAEMAAEVGIDKDALDRATTELVQSQAEDAARRTQAEALSAERGRQLARFSSGLVAFLVAGGVFYVLNKQVPLPEWVFWVLGGWGVLILLRLRHVLFPQERLEQRRKREARWLERQQRREQRHAWKNHLKRAFTAQLGPSPAPQTGQAAAPEQAAAHERAAAPGQAGSPQRAGQAGSPGQAGQAGSPGQAGQASREFENAVQAGVAALLGVAARKIQEHAARNSGRRG
jgi:hypothetical protein